MDLAPDPRADRACSDTGNSPWLGRPLNCAAVASGISRPRHCQQLHGFAHARNIVWRLGIASSAGVGRATRLWSFSSHLLRADHSGLIDDRSEEHTSELQSLLRISYAVFCLKIKTTKM